MTQEEKELLLKDLCGRLPYGVKIAAVVSNCKFNTIGGYCDQLDDFYVREVDGWFNASMIKPYLRPISSMTEEEIIEFAKLFYKWHDDELFDYIEEGVEFSIWKHKGISAVVFDWLNEHHFDYQGLIEKGLALEAPEGMYV